MRDKLPSNMTTTARHHRWMRYFAPVVWLALLQILAVTIFASSPGLHECFHPDAHESGHHCLATDFQSGLLDQPLAVPIVAPSYAPVGFEILPIRPRVRHALPHHLCGSLLEHGPPARA